MEDMNVTATGYDFRPAHAAMQRYVDGNVLAGISSAVLVGRDLADVTCVGWADKDARIPLRVDHIFRVFSNTKLVTSCAVLLLLEDGRLKLDDPIDKLIPQLASRRVLRPGATSLEQTEPAIRPITRPTMTSTRPKPPFRSVELRLGRVAVISSAPRHRTWCKRGASPRMRHPRRPFPMPSKSRC